MSCEHCEHIRARQRALIEELGDTHLHYREKTEMTARLSDEQWTLPASLIKTQAACTCECHDVARIVGKLPKVVVA